MATGDPLDNATMASDALILERTAEAQRNAEAWWASSANVPNSFSSGDPMWWKLAGFEHSRWSKIFRALRQWIVRKRRFWRTKNSSSPLEPSDFQDFQAVERMNLIIKKMSAEADHQEIPRCYAAS
eukprot:TRINITY_DN20297_c0_g1_i1.p1 TRINITY_DN20297_c0_g1~~TRINITY_DN20297_c0_g1_i1.p1  ORF type:complete len:126 (+),score=5.77 TRINITY_DN20297_c0_g1_i1:71-448(+)